MKTIISLTSYPARIYSIARCAETLLSQTADVDDIVLWLAEDEFPEKESELPEDVLALTSRGLSIRWCPYTLGPHDKYYWIAQEEPAAKIITVDDDIYGNSARELPLQAILYLALYLLVNHFA